MNCPFCTLAKERIIYESPLVSVVLSNPRLMPGHTLIVPKRHVQRLAELTKPELDELIATAIQFQEKLLRYFPGCDMRQHYRPFIPQNILKVDHLHIHLHPRENKDELYQKVQRHDTELFKPLPPEEATHYQQLLRE